MAVNPFFNELTFGPEQGLLDDLNREAIEIHGFDCKYLPKKLRDEDLILNEDPQAYFDQALQTTFYLKNAGGFEGPGNFLSVMGVEIRDQITLTVHLNTFREEVGSLSDFRGGLVQRPREGDLIFFPQNQKLFEIVWVQKFDVFFQLGTIYTLDLTCQLVEASTQDISVGIPAIDSSVSGLSEGLYDWALLAEDGAVFLAEDGAVLEVEQWDPRKIDPFDQGEDFDRMEDSVFDFSETDPFAEGRY